MQGVRVCVRTVAMHTAISHCHAVRTLLLAERAATATTASTMTASTCSLSFSYIQRVECIIRATTKTPTMCAIRNMQCNTTRTTHQVRKAQTAKQQQQQVILRATSSRKNRSAKNVLRTVLRGTLPSCAVML
jgi:hypothetical protein